MFLRLLLAGLLAAALATAQRGAESRGQGPTDNISPPAPSAPARIDIIANALKLSKDQKKQVKAFFDDIQKQATPVRDEMLKSRLKIAEAVQAGKSPDEVNQAVSGYAATVGRMTALEMKAFASMYLGLEPDQRKAVAPVYLMMNGIFKGKNWNEPE